GAFIVSVIGNLIPFFPIPYLMAIFLLATTLQINPIALGLISGFGGGLGKLITYYIGRGTGKLIYRKGDEQLEALKKLLGNYGAIAAFLVAATPSPDDIVIIILGMIEYDVKKFLVAITAGKIVISLLVALSGNIFSQLARYFGGEEATWPVILASLIIMIIVTIVIDKVDWVKVLEEINSKGWKRFVLERIRTWLKKS
ncbi:MAG: hypothetical protein DRJ51_08400, partial [Thermoprotei archaeon]